MRTVLVPATRVRRWLQNFESRHGSYVVTGVPLTLTADDGCVAVAHRPLGLPGAASVPELLALPEVRWGLLLVRKGGFAIAAGTSPEPSHTKVGRRHVQGRSKAGGWSQQRFARRRGNQAREAYAAAAVHAHRILVEQTGGLQALVCGGDRSAVDAVLHDPRLNHLTASVTEPWLPVSDPNVRVLDQAVADAWSIRIEIEDPSGD